MNYFVEHNRFARSLRDLDGHSYGQPLHVPNQKNLDVRIYCVILVLYIVAMGFFRSVNG